MNKSLLNVSLCECVTDCIDKTDKATELAKSKPRSFNAKERQFFVLLSNDDLVSKNIKTKLATNVDVTDMLNVGLVKQTKKCINFNQLLTQNTSKNLSTKKVTKKNKINTVFQTNTQNATDPFLQILAGF